MIWGIHNTYRSYDWLAVARAESVGTPARIRGAGQRYRTVASWYREPDRDGSFGRALAGLVVCCAKLGLFDEAGRILHELRAELGRDGSYDVLFAEGVYALCQSQYGVAEERFGAAARIPGTPGGSVGPGK